MKKLLPILLLLGSNQLALAAQPSGSLLPSGMICQYNYQCASSNCGIIEGDANGTCLSANGEICKNSGECASHNCDLTTGICTGTLGKLCKNGGECDSNVCTNGLCYEPACSSSDCLSAICALDSNGNQTTQCVYQHCQDNGDCASNVCNTTLALCQNQRCTVDSDCGSGICGAVHPGVCTYFPCRHTTDCPNNNCVNSFCAGLPAGATAGIPDRCLSGQLLNRNATTGIGTCAPLTAGQQASLR